MSNDIEYIDIWASAPPSEEYASELCRMFLVIERNLKIPKLAGEIPQEILDNGLELLMDKIYQEWVF